MRRWSIIPSALFLLVALVYPLLSLVWNGVSLPPTSSRWNFTYGGAITAATVAQAIASALLAGIIGSVGALLYSELRLWFRNWFWRISYLCFSLPTVLVALSLIGWFGGQGFMGTGGWFAGWPAILVAHAFLNFPLFVRIVGLRLISMERTSEKTALSLGASRLQVFRWVTWPKIRGSFSTAFFLAFLYCSTSLVILLLLGGGPRYTTLEVAIYQSIRVDLDVGLAVRFSLLQWAISAVLFWWVERHAFAAPSGEDARGWFPIFCFRSRSKNAILWASFLLFFGLFALGPIGVMIGRGIVGLSAAPNGNSLSMMVVRSLFLSSMVGLVATLIAFPLARFHHRTRSYMALDWLYQMPAVVSTLALTLSWWLAYPGFLRDRSGGLLAVIGVQSLLAFPLVYRSISDAFRSLEPSLYRSAQSLGAGEWQIIRWIELPLLARALSFAFLVGALFSLGEVTSLIIFSPSGFETLAWGIFRRMGRYQFGESYVLATMLIGLILSFLFVASRVDPEKR